MKPARSFRTSIDLSSSVREPMIALLNQQLADTSDLYSQTKQAHWNVKGVHFIALHELFDKLAGVLVGPIDDVAERVTALGGTALGTTRMAAGASRLPEYPLDAVDGMANVKALIERYAMLAASTRKSIDTASSAGDADTADLFTQLSRELDKALWFLEAHVQE